MVKNLPAHARNARNVCSIPESGRTPGEGKGNLLQYSCLENFMVRGSWQAAIHGAAKSHTQLGTFMHTYIYNKHSWKYIFFFFLFFFFFFLFFFFFFFFFFWKYIFLYTVPLTSSLSISYSYHCDYHFK